MISLLGLDLGCLTKSDRISLYDLTLTIISMADSQERK